MRWIHEGVHQAYGHRFHAALSEDPRYFACFVLIERLHYHAGMVDALAHYQSVAAADIGWCHVVIGIPQLFLVGAANLDHIAETACADHRGGRQAACDQSIGGDRGAVRKQRHILKIDLGLAETIHGAL